MSQLVAVICSREVNQLHTPLCLQACGALIQLLRSEYRLTEHFRTVRLFLLMEAGDTMLHFYSDVFQRVSIPTTSQVTEPHQRVRKDVSVTKFSIKSTLSVQTECRE